MTSVVKGFTLLCATLVLLVGSAVAAPAPRTTERPSGPDHHPAQVLVAWRDGTSDTARAVAHAALSARPVATAHTLGLELVQLPHGLDPATAARRYEKNPLVRYAQLNHKKTLLSVPNDRRFAEQWGLHNTGGDGAVTDADVDAPEGFDAAFGSGSFENSGGTLVGVLDSGIDHGHEDLAGKTGPCASSHLGVRVENFCQDSMFHGTHVAGIIAATANNGVGVAGVAPNVRLAVYRAFDSSGSAYTMDIVLGLEWLTAKGVKVINMSYGSDVSDRAEKQAIAASAEANVLLVAAAGNDYDDTTNYPAGYPAVMSVTATNAMNAISDFANCNSSVEIAAPGEAVLSTFPGDLYLELDGTSMAAPHVSGIAAMVMSEEPSLSAAQVRRLLVATGSAGVRVPRGRKECGNGYPLVNLAAALGRAAPDQPATPAAPGTIAGRVSDSRTEAAIANATVDCGSAGRTSTASDGRYSIDDVSPGTYSCVASAMGYRARSRSVSVFSATTSTADFALRSVRTSRKETSGGTKRGGGKKR